MDFSVHVPFVPTRAEQIAPVGALVQRSRVSRLWIGQSVAVEPHQLFAYCAGLGFRFPVGTSVTLMPLRHPYEAAIQARSLAQVTGNPVIAGYGPGATEFQSALLGRPYPSPLAAAREYLAAVREILDGEQSFPHPAVHLGLGVLRPGMARLAGEVADTAITWMCPPAYLRDVVVPAMATAAQRAGRRVPRLVSVVHVAQTKPGRDPVALAGSVCGAHLQAPHYVDMLDRAGIRVDPTDPRSGARALVDAGVFLTGTIDELINGLAAYAEAGVDEVVLNLSAVGLQRGDAVAVRELEFLLSQLGLVNHERR